MSRSWPAEGEPSSSLTASPRPPGRRPSTGGPAARRTAPPRSSPRRSSCAGPAWSRTRPASRWRAPARAGPGPTVASSASSVAVIPPGTDRSCPAAQAWQVSKQTPTSGWFSSASKYGPELLDRGGQRLAAARGRLDQQPGAVGRQAVEHRQQPLAQLAQRRLVAVLADGRAGVHDDARGSRAAAPRARLCAIEAIDCSTVASVGEPTLTRNGVWMNDGMPALGAARGEQGVLRRVAGGQLPAARVADEDLHGAGADGVGVGQAALGQAALDLECVRRSAARLREGSALLEAQQDLDRRALLDGLAGRGRLADDAGRRRTTRRRPAGRPPPGSAVASSAFLPVTSGTVTCGRPADTWMSTVLP